MSAETPRELPALLDAEWRLAREGDTASQAAWECYGCAPSWDERGLTLRVTDGEWAISSWAYGGPAALAALGSGVVEVTVSGRAAAAGLSFGDFKDFLVELSPDGPPRRLQLQLDAESGTWLFRVDGQQAPRRWWDAAVGGAADLVAGTLSLKARHAEGVRFENLTLRAFASSCRLSVIITCHRFLQRLRVTLRNWCHQTLDGASYELLIVNPGSPDGTHEHLAAVAGSYPEVRVRELLVEPELRMNKGAMINRAVQASFGEWIWLTDADCLFGSDSATLVLERVRGSPGHLYFGERHHLTSAQTQALLAGRYDGLADFDRLASAEHQRASDRAPWGFTQIVHRSVMDRARYRDDIHHFAYTDNAFIEDCARLAIRPRFVEGLFCLHLDHPFSWYGNDAFL
jgi:hypothetical protein